MWRQKDGRTEVDLTLDPYRSIFVVFRDSELPADHVVSVISQATQEAALEIVKARFGASSADRWMDVTEKLKCPFHFRRPQPARQSIPASSAAIPCLTSSNNSKWNTASAESHSASPSRKESPSSSARPPLASALALTALPDGTVTASSPAATRAELVFASGKRAPVDTAGTRRARSP